MNKKWLWLTLVFLMAVSPVFGASQWDKNSPAGTTQLADLDTNIAIDNEAIDRVLANYRNGAYGYSDSVAQFKVSAGDVVISNSAGTTRRFRSNPSATTVTWADLDTGAEAGSAVYYYYACAESDATTFTIKISVNSSAPTGITYYKKLGAFYNNSSSDIEIGGIIEMYSGFVSAIPPGYVLCDGTNGTVDLSDKFVIGTKAGSVVGAVGTSGGAYGGSGAVMYTDNPGNVSQQQGSAGSGLTHWYQHTHSLPPYYALCYIQRQGVE